MSTQTVAPFLTDRHQELASTESQWVHLLDWPKQV